MRRQLLALLGSILCSCNESNPITRAAASVLPDHTPASISFNVPGLLVSAHEVSLGPDVRNKAGDRLAEAPVRFSVEPAEVGVVTQDQGFRCIHTGDATITASSGAATHAESVRCRLVEMVKVPAHVLLIIPNDPVEPKVTLLDEQGNPLKDVSPVLTSADPQVVAIERGRLRPLQVGVSRVTVTAGARRATLNATVYRKVKSEPLLLNDGTRYNLTLGQGSYEAEIRVQSGGTAHGVTLQWIGGEYCENKGEAQEITARCRINNTGSLIITNPSTFGLGPAADGFLNIYEVP